MVVKICSASGCDRPAVGRGLCNTHHKRLMRCGDVNNGRTTRNGEPLAWLRKNIDYSGEKCLRWPFGGERGGYGIVSFEGRPQRAHHVMMLLRSGGTRPEGREVAHSCGNKWCVNPSHLRWATRPENLADRTLHGQDNRGERNGGNKLTKQDVLEIRRRLRTHEPQTSIARAFGVSGQTVSKINLGQKWAWLI